MLRVISELKPTWVIGENVPGIINMELDKALSDLEDQGYEAQPLTIPACAIDADHRRSRVWILAYSKRARRPQSLCSHKKSSIQAAFKTRSLDICRSPNEAVFAFEKSVGQPAIFGMDDGVPGRVDRLRSLGNAVVPQVVEVIGRMIIQAHKEISNDKNR